VKDTLDLLGAVFVDYPGRDFAIRLWDGTVWQPAGSQSHRFTIALNGPAALRRMFFPRPTERKLGEAYMFGDFEIEGNMYQAIDLARYFWEGGKPKDPLRVLLKLFFLPKRDAARNDQIAHLSGDLHSVNRDLQAIQYHYDVSNEFYQLWLDEKLVYSCAYFKDPAESIDTAQSRKLDYICRKLRLEKGQRLLDIGCGWGALIMHAAQRYGVEAVGITLSEKQLALARERIAASGLSDRCQVELLDYRNVAENQPFDKIVNIGMVEHVGRQNLDIYFEKAHRPSLLPLLGQPQVPGGQLRHEAMRRHIEMHRRYADIIFMQGPDVAA